MIITWDEIRIVEDFIQRYFDEDFDEIEIEGNMHTLLTFFAKRPHVFFPSGLDDYISFPNRSHIAEAWRIDPWPNPESESSIYRLPEGLWLILHSFPGSIQDDFSFFSKHSFRRLLGNGNGYEDEDDLILSPDMSISFTDFFQNLYRVADDFSLDQKSIISPCIWTPDAQRGESHYLHLATKEILTNIYNQQKELVSLHWKELEEIVAEVLRARGMEIHLVRENPQGGRDIIARGELIPGLEPLTLAVEVKHKKVVGRPDLDKALWANKQFPALLFVTSGRFTAGVIEEKRKPENQMRLFLKDGVALGDMIRDYGIAKGWRSSPEECRGRKINPNIQKDI